MTALEIIRSVISVAIDYEDMYVYRKSILEISRCFGYSDATMDTLRNQATLCGYLKKTSKLGKYKVIKEIPEELTGAQLRKDYNFRIKFSDKSALA